MSLEGILLWKKIAFFTRKNKKKPSNDNLKNNCNWNE